MCLMVEWLERILKYDSPHVRDKVDYAKQRGWVSLFGDGQDKQHASKHREGCCRSSGKTCQFGSIRFNTTTSFSRYLASNFFKRKCKSLCFTTKIKIENRFSVWNTINKEMHLVNVVDIALGLVGKEHTWTISVPSAGIIEVGRSCVYT
jgi:hypothetical protein